MADPLYELLTPYFDPPTSSRPIPRAQDPTTSKYLTRLSTLPLASLTTTEPQSLSQSTHSNLLSVQALAARSNASLVTSSDHLSSLSTTLPQLAAEAKRLRDAVPRLDGAAVAFADRYSRSAGENEVLDRRKKALLMNRNVDRVSDILDLPALLQSAIASATAQGGSGASGGAAAATAGYASALDLYGHIKRLHLLHRDSALVGGIFRQAEEAMGEMTAGLIAGLRAQNIKLAAGMRTVGWLRRVAPELDGSGSNREGSLGALFLVCRLATLVSMLSALEPLRDLADQETALRLRDQMKATKGAVVKQTANEAWSGGQQTERYLKRYIEIFREQSFAIVSMFKSIFPATPDTSAADDLNVKLKAMGLKTTAVLETQRNGQISTNGGQQDPLNPLPSALATFPLHLVDLLSSTLKEYLPNVRDKSSRESLLTQVLYCAGSLGRLGGDFSLLLADLQATDEDSDDDNGEWVAVMKKHRELAKKLEKMASGGGGGTTMSPRIG